MRILRRIAWGALYFVLGVTGVPTVAGFFSSRGWLFDLAAAFRPLYFVAQALAGVVLLARKRWLGAMAAAVFLVSNGQQIAPLYLPPRQLPALGSDRVLRRIKVLQLNVGIRNSSVEKVLAYATSVDADVFAVEEVSRSLGRRLEKGLSQKYPYQFAFLVDRGPGIALFSKHPLVDPQVVYYADPGLPSIVSKVQATEEEFTVVVTHPLSPTTPYGYRLRNRHLSALVEARQKYSERLIVVGDLNVTSWSSVFSELSGAAGLRDTRKGFGIQPTWPSLKPLPFALAPIDHCLVSPHFRVISRRVGPDVGSDHLPVVIEMELVALSPEASPFATG